MTWHSAPAVKAALQEATQRWPNRNRLSDGTIGDAKHSSRISDHNPDDRGVVLAFDLTHDPDNGCDAHQLVREAVERRDPRIKYAISQGRIVSSYDLRDRDDRVIRRAWEWGPYAGHNRHDKHAHVSVTRAHEDDTSAWWPSFDYVKQPGDHITILPVDPPTREDDDMPLSDEDVEKIAVRTAQHVADGTKRHGTDNLFRLLDRVLQALDQLPAKVAAALKAQQ